MKAFFILAISAVLSAGCGGPADDDNKGAQSDQDYPSNRDRDMNSDASNGAVSTQERQDTTMTKGGQAGQGIPPNQAPNNGDGNPQENIHGQTGTNQTGSGEKK